MMARRSLKQAKQLPGNTPIKRAVRVEEDRGLDEVVRMLSRCNKVKNQRRRADTNGHIMADGGSKRTPMVEERKTLSEWLRRGSPLYRGQKRSAARWYFHWFPRRGMVESQHTHALPCLRKA